MPRLRVSPALLLLLLLPNHAHAQATPGAAADSALLHNYESCTFDDGLAVVKIDALPDGVQQRTIQTKAGPRSIDMEAGRRIMLAYGLGGDFFANVKPEVLPATRWAAEKQTLLDELAFLLSSSHDMQPDTTLPHELHGLEVRGINRTVLQGGTLGFYLLFDDASHIATSVYLLNQEPLTRRFQTIEQYRQLSSRFLKAYTDCIAQNRALRSGSTKP